MTGGAYSPMRPGALISADFRSVRGTAQKGARGAATKQSLAATSRIRATAVVRRVGHNPGRMPVAARSSLRVMAPPTQGVSHGDPVPHSEGDVLVDGRWCGLGVSQAPGSIH